MAIDNTPPRLKLIITIGAITVITLIGVDLALGTYYGYMTTEAQRLKLAPTTDLDEHKKAEKAAFASAATPIDQAMAELAKGSRAEIIQPKPSDDMGPMTGWSKLPKPAPTPAPKTTTPAMGADAGAATAAGDGGAPAMADAGAPHAAGATDAGARPPAAAKDGGAAKPAPTTAPGAPQKQ